MAKKKKEPSFNTKAFGGKHDDKEILKLKDRVTDLEDKWKRAVADYRNLERRSKREAEAVSAFSRSLILINFLTILDNLEYAQKTLKDSGIELIIKQFSEILEREGVAQIECLGKNFNPAEMEAVGAVEGEDNKVIEVTQKGYKMGENVLRPARVKIGKQRTEN